MVSSIGSTNSEKAKNTSALKAEASPAGSIQNRLVEQLKDGMSPAEGSAKSPQRVGLIDAKV